MKFFAHDIPAIRRKGIRTSVLGGLLTVAGAMGTTLPFLGVLPTYSRTTTWPWISLLFGLGLLMMGWSDLREASALERERRLRGRAGRQPPK